MSIGEFELIRRFFDRPARRALLGIGDDCALIAPFAGSQPTSAVEGKALAVTTDMLVSGRHFFSDVEPESLGHKALAVNLSDIAAMGAEPVGFTLALALPEIDEKWLAAFARGLHRLADAHGCELLGGDTTRGPLAISITALGAVEPGRALRRDAGRAGDDLWVSGALGGAAFAVREGLAGRPLPAGHPARERMDRPQPRVALGRALAGLARAAIDVSDGLVADLGHVCERSGVAALVDWASIPVDESLAGSPGTDRQHLALAGGDDYELLFSAPSAARAEVVERAAAGGVRVSRIGRLLGGSGVVVQDAAGRSITPDRGGFDHFA